MRPSRACARTRAREHSPRRRWIGDEPAEEGLDFVEQFGALGLPIARLGLGLRTGRPTDQLPQLLGGAAGAAPINDVALGRQPWQLEDPDRRGDPLENRCDLAGVVAAGAVVVRQDDHVAAGEVQRECLGELACPAGIAGRHESELDQQVDLALALGDQDQAGG
jgi:hypothetical protein